MSMQPLFGVDEIKLRINNFINVMDIKNSDWELAVFPGRINGFYFTGTIQDGVVIIPRGETPVYYVRRSYERAKQESNFPDIRPIKSYREIASDLSKTFSQIHIETGMISVDTYERFKKHFPCENYRSVDPIIAEVRSVKSRYELSLIRKAGKISAKVLEEDIPKMLQEGVSEADFAASIYPQMLSRGHHGVTRFSKYDTEMGIGIVAFGENSLCPSNFDGPGGCPGLSPVAPLLGQRDKALTKGSLVFIDIGCGCDGYHSDKTMTYIYKGKAPNATLEVFDKCVLIQNQMAAMLKPGVSPSEIYHAIIDNLDEEFLSNFMGYNGRHVNFLGHSIGLVIDELPVIADGFNEPIKEGMVFAFEPKVGIKGFGMVGTENTYIVTQSGRERITGSYDGMMNIS